MDSAYIHILGKTYKAGLPLALFSEILKNCDSFLQIKYGNVCSGVQNFVLELLFSEEKTKTKSLC